MSARGFLWAAALCLWAAAGRAAPADAAADFARVSREAAAARMDGRADEAIGLYRRAVAIRPDWNEGWWFLGALLYNQSQYPEARDVLRKLVALDPKAGPGFAILGLCEYETKDYAQALDDINEGRRLGLGPDPRVQRDIYYHAVLLYTLFQRYESAVQVLVKVLQQGDPTPPIVEAAGLAGLRMGILPGQVPAAQEDLVERAGRAVCAMTQNHSDDARKYFADLLAHYPKAPNVHYLYGTFLLGSDAAAALGEFGKELQLDPNHRAALVTMALEYEREGNAAKAMDYARRAIAADPRYFPAHGVLGRVLATNGQVDEGIKELETARDEAPDSPQVHFALASAYALAGRNDEAARERAEFIRLRRLADETAGKGGATAK